MFLFPSIYEGNPNALIEAARLGIPFVSTNINEIVESIHETDRFNLYDTGSIDDAKLIINKIVTNYTTKDDKVINWYNEQYNEDKNFNDFLKTLIV